MKVEKGLTLIEMMIAVSILAVAIMGLLTTIATAQRSNLLCEEERIALDAAMAVMERIREESFRKSGFEELEARYDSDSSNDLPEAGDGSWQFFDPRAGTVEMCEGNEFGSRQDAPGTSVLVLKFRGDRPMYAIEPPVDPAGGRCHPHGQVIVVREEFPNENVYANPFPVDLDGQDADLDGDARNDAAADLGVLGITDFTDAALVVVVVRWRSVATGMNREVVLRSLVTYRDPEKSL